MEDMDIDSVVDIPDTPDRLSVQRMNRGDCVEKEINLSVAGHVGGSNTASEGSLDRLRGRGRLVINNGHNRKHYIHPQKPSGRVDEIERWKNTIILSPHENARENASLFRKTAMERSRNSIREQYEDKGKAPCSKVPSKSSGFQEDHSILDLTEHNLHSQIPEKAFPQDESKNHFAEGRKGQVPINGGSYFCNSSNNSTASRNKCKGKEKMDDIRFKSVGSVTDRGKGLDLSHCSPHGMEKQLPTSHHSVVTPKAVGKKRLVRNGCISPHNIAIRAKQLNEQSQDSFKAEQNFGNVVRDVPCMIDISEIVAENNIGKGKGVIHPHTSEEPDINFINLSGSPMSNDREPSGICDSNRDSCFERKGDWRSTHNHSQNVDHAAERHFSRFNNVQCQASQQSENRVVKRDNASGGNSRIDRSQYHDATEKAPVVFSKFNQISEPSHAKNMLSRRQTKHVLTSRNNGESSRVIPNDSDIVFLGSSRESSSSRSSRIQGGQHLDVLDVDESSEMRGNNADNMNRVNGMDSEARTRQVEADEMLARELQEQLYNETPIFGDGEIDENIAWALQQEDHAVRPTSIRSLREPDHRGSTRHSRIQPPTRTSQNSSNRRGVQARLPTSARVSRLRSRVSNQPRAAPSRSRNFRFPFDMDLDMRLDILEAMEAAIGDADDMGMSSQFFQFQRDFNENDYEMLLALDDNNHQHGGASVNQINSLPMSKVQTDNFEACAICLETPAIGDTIRHLPCLHKFHKDCIDPWLGRKMSCPVCKSSIT
ncbi:hypothetical protein PTKIN_Ptkin09bG0218600 [Pterospermum kingtungense]